MVHFTPMNWDDVAQVLPVGGPPAPMNRRSSIRSALCGLLLVTGSGMAANAPVEKPTLTVESDSLRLALGANAHTTEFTDKSSGTNYCARNPGAAFARVKKAGKFLAKLIRERKTAVESTATDRRRTHGD